MLKLPQNSVDFVLWSHSLGGSAVACEATSTIHAFCDVGQWFFMFR